MNKEIKEILELYKDNDIEYYNLCSDLGYDKLLDYITNLEQENEELKEDLKAVSASHFSIFERNKRAIEHIKEHTENIDRGQYYEDYVETYDLLNILTGDTPTENLYQYTPEKGFELVGGNEE